MVGNTVCIVQRTVNHESHFGETTFGVKNSTAIVSMSSTTANDANRATVCFQHDTIYSHSSSDDASNKYSSPEHVLTKNEHDLRANGYLARSNPSSTSSSLDVAEPSMLTLVLYIDCDDGDNAAVASTMRQTFNKRTSYGFCVDRFNWRFCNRLG